MSLIHFLYEWLGELVSKGSGVNSFYLWYLPVHLSWTSAQVSRVHSEHCEHSRSEDKGISIRITINMQAVVVVVVVVVVVAAAAAFTVVFSCHIPSKYNQICNLQNTTKTQQLE